MTPAFYVIYGIILTLLAVGLLFFGGCAYYLAVALKEAGAGLTELAQMLHGLPQNLYGVSPALAKLADGVTAHEAQVAGLVAIIADANKAIPPDKPEPFIADGKDTNWKVSIPQTELTDEENR